MSTPPNVRLKALRQWWSSWRAKHDTKDRLTVHDHAQIAGLRGKIEAVWDQFGDEIDEEMRDENVGTPWAYNEAVHQAAPYERRIRNIEAVPWLRAARDLDIEPIPILFDEENEADDAAFANLKRMVRSAEWRVGRATLETKMLRAGFILGVATLGVAAFAAYSEFVFERDHAHVIVELPDFVEGRTRTKGLLGNGGTRQIAITSMMVIAMGPGSRTGLGGAVVEAESDQFPIIIEPGHLKPFKIVQRFDISRAFAEENQGRRVAPDLKAIDFWVVVGLSDASGEGYLRQFPLYTQFISPEGPTNPPTEGPSTQVLEQRVGRGEVLLSELRWFGRLAP